MDLDSSYHLDLQSLIEDDLSSYEYYTALSNDVRKRLKDGDIHTFLELQSAVNEIASNSGQLPDEMLGKVPGQQPE